ncbi:MAG: hypothetical protein AABP62_16795 [Planctomycetota bacterium]
MTLVSGSAAAPSEFSGFQIGDPTDNASGPVGHGIVGDGAPGGVPQDMSNILVTQTDVNFAGGEGVRLTELTGPVVFRGVFVNDPVGPAFHVSGGIGGVTFTDDAVSGAQGRIENSGDRALLVENTLVGSFVNLTGSTITDTAGLGILIDGANGSVTVDDSTINGSLVRGIEIQGGGGTTTFRGAVVIDDAALDAISIHDTLAGSSVTFSQVAPGVTITNRNAHGVNVFSTIPGIPNLGNVLFRGPVLITDTVGSGAAAVEYQDSSGDLQFQTLNISGGGGQGILIGGGGDAALSNTGQFLVTGATDIFNVAANGVLITDDDAQVQFNGLTVRSRGLSGISIHDSRGSVSFLGFTSIDNAFLFPSFSPAVDIQDNITAGVVFDTLTITDATRPFPLIGGAGLNVINNPPFVSVGSLNVTTLDGTALFASNAGVVTTTTVDGVTTTTTSGGIFVGTGVIDSVGSVVANFNFGRPAIDVQDSAIQLGFQSVSSSNSLAEGIILDNNAGPGGTLFTITGQVGVPLSGGTITGAFADGAFFRNTGGVSLENMNILANFGTGIFIESTELFVGGSLIQQNFGVGVDVRNTAIASLVGNTITGNGLNEVRFTAATADAYSFILGGGLLTDGNLITDGSDHAVLVQTQGGGAGSTLNLGAFNNTIIANAGGTNAFRLNWNGGVTGSINVNTFNFGTTGSTGLFVNLGSASLTQPSNLEILSNTFNGQGGFAKTGIDITTNGAPNNISIGQLIGQLTGNVMNFTSPGAFTGDIGMRFSLGGNSNVNIFNNSIVMLSDGGTGMQFSLVQGPSNLTIDNNVIDIASNIPVLVETGIEILGVSGTVTLFGTQNNDIILRGLRDSVPPWFSAPAAINGQIIVNGVTLFP